MVHGGFIQPGFDKALAHAIEEAGEFLAAAGKTQRFGAWSVNPLLEPAEQETNADWLAREMGALQVALERLAGNRTARCTASPSARHSCARRSHQAGSDGVMRRALG